MFDAPIAEVSGACFAGSRLVIVGDAEPVLAWTPWDGQPGQWTSVNVAKLPGAPADTGQFEAVEHLHDDVVVILCEEPALLVAVDIAKGAVTGWWHLNVELKGLAKAWRKEPNSHGEGLFFGKDRVFVVKEKKPAAIVEFGLPGERSTGYVAGRWQPPTEHELVALEYAELDVEDVSDACLHDGQIWLLSDQDRSFGPINGDWRPLDVDKPEGLARTPEGSWLVAVDNKDGRGALWVME